MSSHTECINEIIKSANVSTIQSCVRLNDIRQLGYAYSHVIENHFGVKKGTASFGIRLSELFAPYECTDRVRMEEVQKQLRFHKVRYKTCFSPDLKKEHREAYNKLVDEERALYKPIRKFVALANKIKNSI